MFPKSNRPPRSSHNDSGEGGSFHVPGFARLDRRHAARICRHHKQCGLRITVSGGVTTLRFRKVVGTREEVQVMREVAGFGPFQVYNPARAPELQVSR